MSEKNMVSDIKVVNPGDKLLIKLSGSMMDVTWQKSRQTVLDWLNGGHILFVDDSVQVWVVKNEAKIKLERAINDASKN